MAPTPSSILSTHSGHHRIFIGPVVQKSTTTTGNGTASTFSTSHHPRRKGQAVRTHTNHHHRNNVAPKPWWDQGSYLRSHLSLHSITQPGSGDAPSVPATTGGNAGGGGAASNTSSKQSSIPQLSYTFSDDSSTDESIDTQDEVIGEDDTDDEEDKEKERHVYHDHTAASSSSESLSAPVGHDEPPPSNNDSSESRGIGVGGIGASGKTKMIGKGKQRAIEDEDHQGVELDTFHFNDNTNEQYQLNQSDKSAAGAADPGISSTLASGLGRLRTKAKKKRSKSLRDEGEPTGLRKFFGQYREGRHHQGQLDNPDLGWESDDQGYGGSSRPRTTRHATSGALTNVQPTQQPHDGYRSVLVSSPMSSNIDLPGAHQGPVFVSSPMSSALDVNETNLERPEPTPIQKLSPDSANSDHLGPGWKPSPSTTSLSSPPLSPTSPSSPTSPTSPLNDKPQRVATWMTARETISSTGRESLHGQAIKEEDEEDEEDEDGEEDDDEGGVAVGRSEDDDNDDNGASDLDDDDDVDDADEHYSLAKVISRESRDGAGVQNNGRGGKGQGQGARRTDQEATNEMTTSRMTPRTTTTITNEKEPLSSTLSKAGTRFGRALLDRAPTGLKRQNGMPLKNTPQQRESMCSVDKDCHGSIDHHLDASTMPSSAKPKKHVRFLTKVQTQIASGRQPTLLTTHPVIKQDRMLVRKEVTERPGPHVFNSDTARRLERLSQGWREWWCVMKGAPAGNQQPEPVTKIRKKSKAANRVEKGRLEFYYNHKKISGTVIFSSDTSVSVYSSLDYSIAVTQNYREEVGLTAYILRPRTIALACAWYMDIYTLLHGAPPIPTFIEIAVPDFDVKVRVPIPEDSETETDMDDDSSEDNQSTKDLGLSSSLPLHGPQYTATTVESGSGASTSSNAVFRTARTSFPARMATKTFYLTDDKAKPTLVAPDEVTPKLLRSHVLHLLKDVSDWTEVVKTWLDPTQHGDVALCWKRYDRIEWIYWNDRVLAETDSIHLRKDHIGFADGSEWSGRMDETVVGPQVLDKTHRLELRPITHYPTKARQPGPHGVELQEPDPIEGYLVRVSTFSGNPIRRFRRLYLTSHDHLLIYTIPSQSNSPTMQHAGSIDPSALMFSITPHRSVNPDHKDIAQSRSVRRLKAQVRAARGFLDMTKIESVRVLSVREWEAVRHLSYARKDEWCDKKETKREKLGKAVQRVAEAAQDNHQQTQQQQAPTVIVRNEADNYFFPNILTEPVESSQEQTQGSSSQQQQEQQEQQEQEQGVTADRINGHPLAASEPLNNSLGRKSATHGNTGKGGSFKEGIVRSATFVADFLLHNDQGQEEEEEDCDSNVIEIQMKDGPCVRFRAYSAEAAHLWSDQLEKLAEYWTLRKHLDVKDHMCVAQANYQLASSLDDDEVQVGTGKAIQEWDNDRAMVSPQVWNWCVVNGCRSITKSGMVYFKPKLYSPFQKMFLVLTEGYLMLFHPHRRSKTSGRLIPTTVSKLYAIHSLTDVYLYSGRFSDEDTYHGTNDESERLPRFFPDGLIVDDPDDDCTFSIWRGQRRTMFSRKGSTLMTMSAREVGGSSKIFGKDGLLSSMVKEGVVYGSAAQSCSVFRARSRPDLEEWVYAINTEIERCVRGERRRVRTTGHL